MKKKIIIISASAIPMLVRSPYLLSAWSNSRLDQWDWLFYLLTVPAAVFACRNEKRSTWDMHALILLIPMLILSLGTPFHQINALGVAASAGCIFAAVWLTCSWSFACCMIPAAVILLLGTPSSSYLVSLLLMLPVWMAWSIKFLAAAFCFGWIWCNKKFNLKIKIGTILFLAATISSCLLLLHTGEIYFEGKSFIPAFSAHVGNYWGRSIQPDENTKRFFVTSQVKQFRFTRDNIDISVLAVKCGKNIHEIHPASHCLRTSNWMILSENILYLQSNFAVTEIDAQKGKERFLVWVWYSGEEFSTPGFLGFRKHFRAGKNYYTYQISTPVHNSTEKSRSELKMFIRSLNREISK